MSSSASLHFPITPYPERKLEDLSTLDETAARWAGQIARRVRGRISRFAEVPERVEQASASIAGATVLEAARALREELRLHGLRDDLVARSFALVREVAAEQLGQRHYDVQLLGGWVLLQGMVAEMQTGEGKTLTATLPASTAALSGLPVHVVTVNDYLARRDAESMRPVYEGLGLRVGYVVSGMSAEERRAAYACDVTYCPNNEVAFDSLKDAVTLGRDASRLRLDLEELAGKPTRREDLILRGLCYAIVDEADSVMVDEARTPLILSGGGGHSPVEEEVYHRAVDLARRLDPERHFSVAARDRDVRINEAGRREISALSEGLGGPWRGERRRQELVGRALAALHLFDADTHYLVRDGKVVIVDEFTGRVMGDRSWEQGLHQMIEVKEGVALTARLETLARTSYQRFFRRYQRLAGMTGTAREVASELQANYGLPVVTLPTHRPLKRRELGERILPSAAERWECVVERVQLLHAEQRPVLIGTRSVSASEQLSALLDAAGVPHRVLNARQDRDEAELIASAGKRGQVTVATNMAGRGTDIVLGPGVAEQGGLCVIATERHESRRIDRQLAGRCGRQGDPGCVESIVSLEDEIVTTFADPLVRALLPRARSGAASGATRLARRLLDRCQSAAEGHHARTRRALIKQEKERERLLAFSGADR